MAIQTNATTAIVPGVEMQIISIQQADNMISEDPEDLKFGECILENGRFIFESEKGKLKTLYKVQN